jgi:hypothetical protein
MARSRKLLPSIYRANKCEIFAFACRTSSVAYTNPFSNTPLYVPTAGAMPAAHRFAFTSNVPERSVQSAPTGPLARLKSSRIFAKSNDAQFGISVGPGDGDADADILADGETEADGERDGDGLTLRDLDDDGLILAEKEKLADGDADRDADGETEADFDAEGLREADADAEGLILADGDKLALGEIDGDFEADGLTLALGLTLTLGETEIDPTGPIGSPTSSAQNSSK